MLNGVFSDKADSKITVVGLNKVMWDYRCRIIYEREAFVFEVLKARLVALVKHFLKTL